jgi:phosphate/sulfate permease
MGALFWNLITWYVGLPTSSSHALIGGYGGAAIAAYGSFVGILKPEGWTKTIIFIAASPLIGMTLGFLSMVAVHWIFRRSSPHSVDRIFRKGQLVSAAAVDPNGSCFVAPDPFGDEFPTKPLAAIFQQTLECRSHRTLVRNTQRFKFFQGLVVILELPVCGFEVESFHRQTVEKSAQFEV